MDLSYNILKNNLKKNRKLNAIKLPDGITQEMIPMYVVYYKECYNKEKNLFREYFKIDKHPNLSCNKIYTSSKSNKISIFDKLIQIKTILFNLQQNSDLFNFDLSNSYISNSDLSNNYKIDMILPKYVCIKPHEKDINKINLIYDKKYGDKRYTTKHTYNKNIDLSNIMNDFMNKIHTKLNL